MPSSPGITSKDEAFLRGEIAVPRSVWPREKYLPATCVDGELVYVKDVVQEDWSVKKRYAEEYVGQILSPTKG